MSSIYDVCWYLFFFNNRWFELLNVQYICWYCRPFYCYLLYSVLDLCWRKDGRCSSVHNILMIFEWCSKVVVVKIFFVMWLWSLWCVRPFPIWTKNILTSDSLWFCLLTLCIWWAALYTTTKNWLASKTCIISLIANSVQKCAVYVLDFIYCACASLTFVWAHSFQERHEWHETFIIFWVAKLLH